MDRPDQKRAKQRLRHLAQDRGRRIRRLIEQGIISDAKEIPEHAIPVDPDASTKAQAWSPAAFYEDIDFDCIDCGTRAHWSAESQQYYFEVMKASPYKQAKRCYDCRQKEVERRNAARQASGHGGEAAE